MLPWGKLGDGVTMVGGRGRGIFFHTQKKDTKGLKSGDQLVKVCNQLLLLLKFNIIIMYS